MADEAQVKILKEEGVKTWNEWRIANPKTRPDLRRANLSELDLRDSNLTGANLTMANLVGANLIGAKLGWAKLSQADLQGTDLSDSDLFWADLSAANLREANLKGANPQGANLRTANLSGTNLRETDLSKANLSGADLSDGDLSEAVVGDTNFANVDLSQAKGLETITHLGPSEISISTIYRSHGKIPFQFLRGAGIPDNFIEYMHSLVGTTFEFYSCFISYSSKDQEFAERLHADLQDRGVRCWFAPHHGQGGQKLHVQIDEAIRLHEKLLLILSADSIKSEWVKTEIKKAARRQAREKKDVLFPVSLVPFSRLRKWKCWDGDLGKDLAGEIREYLIPDFSKWKEHDSYQKAFAKLLKDLRSGKKSTAAVST